MTDRILFVDDEPHLLDTYRRMLRGLYEIETAEGPMDGLRVIEEKGPFAVVVSDQRMPGMDGVTFLARTREISPDSIRVMLTGYSDVEAASAAVNEGNVFRFLTKPCPFDDLQRVLKAGLEQYRLVVAERELLRDTLHGAIKVLSEILSLASPSAFGRASRIQRYVGHMARRMQVQDLWKFDIAGLLSQIGCVSLSPETLDRVMAGRRLDTDEEEAFEAHPIVAGSLLAKIPRLQPTAEMIARQRGPTERFKGSPPIDDEVALGGEMLRLALAVDEAVSGGEDFDSALREISRSAAPPFDKRLLDALKGYSSAGHMELTPRMVHIRQLEVGMLLDEDVRARTGTLLLAKGFEVTSPTILRLKSFAGGAGVVEPFRVLAPAKERARSAA